MTRTVFPDDTARTRKSDPVTSHESADSNQVALSQAAVLTIFRTSEPLADFEVQQKLAGRYSPERIRTARHELAEAGVLTFTGYYHLTPRGRRAQVWALAPQGEQS